MRTLERNAIFVVKQTLKYAMRQFTCIGLYLYDHVYDEYR